MIPTSIMECIDSHRGCAGDTYPFFQEAIPLHTQYEGTLMIRNFYLLPDKWMWWGNEVFSHAYAVLKRSGIPPGLKKCN